MTAPGWDSFDAEIQKVGDEIRAYAESLIGAESLPQLADRINAEVPVKLESLRHDLKADYAHYLSDCAESALEGCESAAKIRFYDEDMARTIAADMPVITWVPWESTIYRNVRRVGALLACMNLGLAMILRSGEPTTVMVFVQFLLAVFGCVIVWGVVRPARVPGVARRAVADLRRKIDACVKTMSGDLGSFSKVGEERYRDYLEELSMSSEGANK